MRVVHAPYRVHFRHFSLLGTLHETAACYDTLPTSPRYNHQQGHTMRTSFVTLLFSVFLSTSAFAVDVVKKSSSGICHDTSSSWYEKTKNFTAYATMEACIDSGGRAPRNYTGTKPKDNLPQGERYDRDAWEHWVDDDNDCQNTRAEVLISHSATPVLYNNIIKRCYVTRGKWYGVYSGEYYYDDDDLDIDHIVPLAYAHAHGGDKWSAAQKRAFANDMDNLLPVSASLNRQKSAKGPTDWMPPYQPYRCEYLGEFDGIMKKYSLEYFPHELRVINKMKSACNM